MSGNRACDAPNSGPTKYRHDSQWVDGIRIDVARWRLMREMRDLAGDPGWVAGFRAMMRG